jgi:hypothetical protein
LARFAVISGGAEGAFYVRQLLRADRAGRARVDGIVVVDRDAGCLARREFGGEPRVTMASADWVDWLEAELRQLPADAQLVPYHWAPHVLLEWLRREVGKAGGRAERGPSLAPRGLPFEASVAHGDRALSYASWICPATCIEPLLCPHTRGPKDWSLAADLLRPHAADAVLDRIVFRCLHYAYGVGTIPVADILAARERLLAPGSGGGRSWLVATSSHCHALATTLTVTGLS